MFIKYLHSDIQRCFLLLSNEMTILIIKRNQSDNQIFAFTIMNSNCNPNSRNRLIQIQHKTELNNSEELLLLLISFVRNMLSSDVRNDLFIPVLIILKILTKIWLFLFGSGSSTKTSTNFLSEK